ncbi:MAG: energy transducer TonB [Aeromonas veronii]
MESFNLRTSTVGPAQLFCLAIALCLHLAVLGLANHNTPVPVTQPLPITLSARWVGDTKSATQQASMTAPSTKKVAKNAQPSLKKVVKRTVRKHTHHAFTSAKPSASTVDRALQSPPATQAISVAKSGLPVSNGNPDSPASHSSQHTLAGNSPPIARAPGLHNPEPAYPDLSRRRGEEGRVILKVRVAVDGTASSVEVDKSSGYRLLDREARRTVSRWHFIPGKQNNVAVEAWARVTIIFQIRD